LSPGAPAVDVFANDGVDPVIEGLAFTEGTEYIEVAPGTYDFDVAATGGTADDSILALDDIELEANTRYSIVAYDAPEDIKGLFFQDDFSNIPDDTIRVRPVHTAVGIDEVDGWDVTDPGAPELLFENVDFGDAADPLDLAVRDYAFGLDTNDDQLMDATFDVPALSGGILANFYAVTDESGPFILGHLPTGETVRIDPRGPTGFVRVVHASPDAPAVDVFVDDAMEPAIQGLAFGESSSYTALPAGTYDVDVAPAGGTLEDAVLSVDDLEVEDGEFLTAVAYDFVSDIKVLTFTDNYGSLPPGQVRARAVHTAPAFGPVDVLNIPESGDPTVVYDELEFGTTGQQLDLPAGTYLLGIDTNNDLMPEATFTITGPEGVFANIYAVNDDAGNPSLLVQLRDGTVLPVSPE
ncbi:MAG: DUF4397 domain-containing protein, partial [Gemmatimonadota bacterium]